MNDNSLPGIIFQILSILLVVLGIVENESLILISGLIPAIISIITWYNDKIKQPIEINKQNIKSLRKDLNMQKELNEIKERLARLER